MGVVISELTPKLELFPYQKEAVQWLTQKKHALLALDCGLGKTAVAITAANQIKAQKILVYCPAVAVTNWRREFELFSDQALTPTIISYGMAKKGQKSGTGSYDLLILDESHFLKSMEAQRTRAIFGINGPAHAASRVWCLTATPMPNNASELWPMLYTFGVTPLPYPQFVERYCTGRTVNLGNRLIHQITGTRGETTPELRSLLQKVTYRKTKDDVMFQLPKIHYSQMFVEPGTVDLEIDSSFVKYFLPKNRTEELFLQLEKERDMLKLVLNNSKTFATKAKVLDALCPTVATLRRYTGLQKVNAVAELVAQELKEKQYEKIVLFALHQGVIEGLRNKLERFGVVTLYGQTPEAKRQRNIDAFQFSKSTRIFIGNIHAAGTAITLTAAHHVGFVELDWVPASNMQAAMRCHRIGQKNKVFVRFFCLPDSLDDKIATVLKNKMIQIERMMDFQNPFA